MVSAPERALNGFKAEARKLEHQYPHALKVRYRDPSTNPPKAMFQLSGIHCRGLGKDSRSSRPSAIQ